MLKMVNIFFTDWDPIVAAKDSCDSYVIKIPIEVAMLLSAIHWRLEGYDGPAGSGLPLVISENGNILSAIGPYKDSKVIKSTSETYKWLIKSTGNYDYAIKYGFGLVEEYKKRYGKLHSVEGVLIWLKVHVPSCISVGPLTTDVGLGMPNIYKNRADPTQSYKNYLFYEKFDVMKWKYGQTPAWYTKINTNI